MLIPTASLFSSLQFNSHSLLKHTKTVAEYYVRNMLFPGAPHGAKPQCTANCCFLITVTLFCLYLMQKDMPNGYNCNIFIDLKHRFTKHDKCSLLKYFKQTGIYPLSRVHTLGHSLGHMWCDVVRITSQSYESYWESQTNGGTNWFAVEIPG